MRILSLIILLSFFFFYSNGQSTKAIYVGEASWKKVANQKKPQKLSYEKNIYNPILVTQNDNQEKFLVRKANPGMITLRVGPTKPISTSLKIIGKKTGPPEIIQASALRIRDNADFNVTYTDKKNGFPALAAYDFAEDENHDMWIATEKGVMSYDGYN